MTSQVLSAALVVLSCPPCAAHDGVATATVEIGKPLGDVYSERTTDGDAYPQSLALRVRVARDRYAVVLDYRRNVYQTETRGAGTLTSYARIEGGEATSVPFLARESAFEMRFEHAVGRGSRAVGIGVLRTWTNYHYPALTGVGFGLNGAPAAGPGLRPFGSAYYYPAAVGAYSTERRPAIPLQTSFRIVKLDYGLVVRSARTKIYVVAGYGNEFRRGNGLPADNRFIRSDPYFSVGIPL